MTEKDNKYVICLGRQYGSGGHKVGQYLSQMLGIEYYDKEIIAKASSKSGIVPEFFEKADERAPGSFSQALTTSLFAVGGAFAYNNALSNDNIFMHQADVIRSLAQKGSCIIVGRCADYILRDIKNCFTVFVSAPMEERVKRIMEREGIDSAEKAEEKAKKVDKLRRGYYNYYTEKHWGRADSYQLIIDSSLLGEQQTACFIRDFVLRALEDR